MEMFVAILIIAVIAAIVFAWVQRRHASAPGVKRPDTLPFPRRTRRVMRRDPMGAAVAEHAQATDPAEAVVAEQRLQAQARNVAAGMQSHAGYVEHERADAQMAQQPPIATDPSLDEHFDPDTGERVDGYGDPATDPRYNDRRYDGRLAADWVDPRDDDRVR